MPINVVKSKSDERKWERSKDLAKEQGKFRNYAYIMGIYKKMKGKNMEKTAQELTPYRKKVLARRAAKKKHIEEYLGSDKDIQSRSNRMGVVGGLLGGSYVGVGGSIGEDLKGAYLRNKSIEHYKKNYPANWNTLTSTLGDELNKSNNRIIYRTINHFERVGKKFDPFDDIQPTFGKPPGGTFANDPLLKKNHQTIQNLSTNQFKRNLKRGLAVGLPLGIVSKYMFEDRLKKFFRKKRDRKGWNK